jgi:DNA-binding MarR family transcriptional regulator
MPTNKPDLLPVINDDPRSWDTKVVVAMIQFQSRLERLMAEALSAHGLTLPQFDVLMTLCHGDGITQQDLAEHLLVTKANVVGLLDRISAAGWVERRRDPEDRRANRIYLTEAGRKLAAEARPGQQALLKRLFEGWNEAEFRQMYGLLERLNRVCCH